MKDPLSPEDRAKVYPFSVYRKLRKLGDYYPAHFPRDLRDSILQKRKEKIAKFEDQYPDFKAAYARASKGFSG